MTLTPRLPLAALLAASTLLGAQTREFRLGFATQQGPGYAGLPATSYRHGEATLLLDFPAGPDFPRLQLSFGGSWASSGEARYQTGTPAGGMVSAAFKPGPYVAVGLGLASRGDFSFGGRVEARLSTNKNSEGATATAQSGTLLSGYNKGATRLWGLLNLAYAPPTGRKLRPVFGVQAGAAAEDGPNPNREFGAFAGIRF
ncbi:MAG: hypothetical protein HY823_10865 [Acidobacteria bacterium]|nr:hypothetical protein [Acidobacteriota bacterium]